MNRLLGIAAASFFCLGVFSLNSCTTSKVRGNDGFREGVLWAEKGDSEAAQMAFKKACEEENAAACQRLEKRSVGRLLPRLAVLQGPTNDTSTTVAILTEKERTPEVFLWESGTQTMLKPKSAVVKQRQFSPWAIWQFTFDGLSTRRDYSLEILDAKGELIDQRMLRALDVKKRTVSVAIASCMDDSYVNEQKMMWQELLSSQPDAIFMIGDNTYADLRTKTTSPEVVWNRYAEVRNLLEVFRTDTLIPVFATWDDHDFGINDGNKTYPYKTETLDIFLSFFPQAPIPGFLERGPGTSSRFTAWGQQFLFLDDRSFRSAAGEDAPTHWGSEQEQWLWQGLAQGKEPAWLINGDQFFGGYHRFESYEGNHPESFKKFLVGIKELKRPVLFVSGDRHLAELMEIKPEELGYKTYELTTSAIHAKTFPDAWKDTPNPRKVEGASGILNYAVIRARADKDLQLQVTVYGPNRQVLFSRALRINR